MGPDRVLADIAKVEFGDWQTRLLRNAAGRIMSCYDNVALMLENSPEWAGVLGFNQFEAGFRILRAPHPRSRQREERRSKTPSIRKSLAGSSGGRGVQNDFDQAQIERDAVTRAQQQQNMDLQRQDAQQRSKNSAGALLMPS